MLPSHCLLTFALYAAKVLAQDIPAPSGPYGVALTTTGLTNLAMFDPWSPTKEHRHIMLSAFYPTSNDTECQPMTVAYMPPSTASIYTRMFSSVGIPNGSFEALRLTVCEANTAARPTNLPKYPVMLFSPGLGNSRLLYNAIAQNLASQGFIVITIDHPHDAAVVEFPDGSLVLAVNITTGDQITAALNVRRRDVSFLIDQLHNTTATRHLLAGLNGSLDLTNIQIYGHSLGGATAVAAMLHDDRIGGGINLDGTFYGDVLHTGLERPFMIFAHEGKNESTEPSWAKVWPLLNGSKVEVAVTGTQHGSYVDYPVLLKVLGLQGEALMQLQGEVGTIDGDRMLHILTMYTKAFFEFVAGQPPYDGLQGDVKAFPEVKVVHSKLKKQ